LDSDGFDSNFEVSKRKSVKFETNSKDKFPDIFEMIVHIFK